MSDAAFTRLKDCRHGKMLYLVNDEYVGRSLDLYGEFSQGEVDLFAKLIGPGDIVIDVGANIGTHTIYFAKATEPGGAVIAFEPQRIVYQCLCANAMLNSLPRIFCFQNAVGEKTGTIIVPALNPRQQLNFGGLPLGRESKGDEVPLVTLDQFGIGKCKLLKVDVEGMELDVLKGAKQTIERTRPILYVECDQPGKADALIGHIKSIGYDSYWHRPPLFSPDNFFKNPTNVFEKVVSLNLLCMPRGTPPPPVKLEPSITA